MRILPSVILRAPEMDLMQVVCPGLLILLYLLMLFKCGVFCARQSKSTTYARNPSAFMSAQ